MAFTNSILAGDVLVREGIRSPNYAEGVSGWEVSRDGSAEFNDIIFRGDLYAGDPDGERYIHVGPSNDTGDQEVHVQSTGGTVRIASVAGSPLIDINDIGHPLVRMGTNSDGFYIYYPFVAGPSIGLLSAGEGIYFGSSSLTRSILYDDDTGFLYVGNATTWTLENWTSFELPAGYTAADPCQYKRFPDGMVRLHGVPHKDSGTIPDGVTLTTLPSGFRPLSDKYFMVVDAVGSGFGKVVVRSTGGVQLYNMGTSVYPSLAGIQFSVV